MLIPRAGDHLRVDAPDQGMHHIAYLGKGASDLEIESAARNAGIIVRAMSRFYFKACARADSPGQLIVPAAVHLAGIVAGV